jgi:RNA polymerase sigma-70 factor (ECF subfamily)
MSDIDKVVHRCQQGELAAFTELFRSHEASVYRLALTILCDEQDAQDAVQDVLLRVFEQIKGYQGNASFKTWLTTITVNLCRDRLRRRKVRYALSLEWIRGWAGPHNVPDEVAQRQRSENLWALVGRLDEKYRLPVILHYYEELPCDEVARILDLTVSTVYSRLNTARLRLRAMAQARAREAAKEARQNHVEQI